MYNMLSFFSKPASIGSTTATKSSSSASLQDSLLGVATSDSLEYSTGVFPGAQGCVVVPSLIVINRQGTRNKEYVTKIFIDQESYIAEKKLNAFVKQIDQTQQFTNVKYNENPINIDLLTDQDIKNCANIIGSRQELAGKKFLNYEYLGKSLHTIRAFHIPIRISDAQSILFGLSKLAVKLWAMNNGKIGGVQVYHNDSHAGNIMYNYDRENIYLIDFGIATINTPKNKDEFIDILKLTETINLFVDYIATSVVLGEKQGIAVTKFREFVNKHNLKRYAPASNTSPRKFTVEQILEAIQNLASGFSESGGKKRKTLKNKKRTLRRKRN
jgi:serine/threonine protein kinase